MFRLTTLPAPSECALAAFGVAARDPRRDLDGGESRPHAHPRPTFAPASAGGDIAKAHSRVGLVNAGRGDDLVMLRAGASLVRPCDGGVSVAHDPEPPVFCAIGAERELRSLASEGWRLARWRCEWLGDGRREIGPDGSP